MAPPLALRPAFYRALAEDADAIYHIDKEGCAVLSKQALEACFDSHGAHFNGAGSPLALHLTGYGRSSDLTAIQPVKPAINGDQASYRYGKLNAWWRVLPMGFEQGFTIAKRPGGNGKLTLALTTNRSAGNLHSLRLSGTTKNERDATLAWGRVRYGKLVVTDASGRVIPATLRSEGNRVLIGIDDTHAAYPLTVDPLVWIEQEVSTSDLTDAALFGFGVAISGSVALIGAPGETVNGNFGQGAVYVFTKSDGVWSKTQKLTANDGAKGDWFGSSIVFSGKTALVGAQFAAIAGKDSQGTVYVFTNSGGAWTQTQKLVSTDGAAGDFFGGALALSGTTALISSKFADINGNARQGAVYVFTDDDGTWKQNQKLVASDGEGFDFFGIAMALNGTTALIGVPQKNVNGEYKRGGAYVFRDRNGTWIQTQRLVASDGAGLDQFGWSVAIDDSIAVIGAIDKTIDGNGYQGAAYVFSNSNGTLGQAQRLTANDGAGGDEFGSSVAVSGTTALVGAHHAAVGDNDYQGAAYVFSKSGSIWLQTAKLTSSDGQPSDNFGTPITTAGKVAFIGAPFGNPGKAYFFGAGNLGFAVNAPRRVGKGQNYVSQTIVTNNAMSASPAVSASIALPAAATFVSATATQGSCNEASSVVICEFGTINGNAGMATANVTLEATGDTGQALGITSGVSHATPPLSASAITHIDIPPLAIDTSLKTHRNEAANGVLKASDTEADPLTFSVVSPPAHGSVTINDAHRGLYTYTPDDGYAAGDSFAFKANDDYADSNVATVAVNIVNRPPKASDGTLTTDKNTAAKGSLTASDPDGDVLSFAMVSPPGHGKITLDAASGNYTYTPASDYFGTDSFTFKANDGLSYSNVATINIVVKGSAPPPPPPPSPSDNGGSGSFGGLLLVLLAGLAVTAILLRHIGRNRNIARALRTAILAWADSPLPWRFSCKGETVRTVPRQDGRKGALGSRQKETDVWMHGKRIVVLTGALALAAIVGVPFTPSSAAAPGPSTAVLQHRPSGLTTHGIVIAHKSGMLSSLVTMAPQTNLKLLAHATKIGPHTPHAKIGLIIGLKLRNKAKLQAFLEQVQNSHSAIYHQWLTPDEFTTHYGPSKADVAKVVAFLKARGIEVKNVSDNRILIHTVAATAVYERALGIRIDDYKLNGRRFFSTSDSPKLPRAIASLVANIIGLNRGVQVRSHSYSKPAVLPAHGLHPRAAPPASLTDMNPLQIAHAYAWPEITDAANGAGATIGIVTGASMNVSASDYTNFWDAFGLPENSVSLVPVDGGGSSDPSAIGETLLDIEYSGAMAPGAALRVYVANIGDGSTDGVLGGLSTAFNQLVQENTVDVMTTSWGFCEAGYPDGVVATDEGIFAQGAAEGISMFAAAGDSGASDSPCTAGDFYSNADYPSSSAYVTAANGTQLTISDLDGTYGGEVVWKDNDCFGNGLASTGGGISSQIARPDWQDGPGVPADVDMRMNSDVALTASCSRPMFTYQSGWRLTAGTSAVAPMLAGLFAVAVSERGGRLGQSNSLIYADVNANDTNYGTDFHDITEGCNGLLPDFSDSCATVNWDHPTGWGSVNATNLLLHIGIQGPRGTLAGSVTAAANPGSAIVGAKILAVTDSGKTYAANDASDGTYSRVLPVGQLDVTVSKFGYSQGTASVSIADGNVTTKDFALSPAPKATLSGKVTDGGGHGYGLYAEIKVRAEGYGEVADIWTDPTTGKYSVKLPKGADYTLHVAAAFDGYNTASPVVTLSGNQTKNVPLSVTTTCSAPGYDFKDGGISEDFNGSTFPPDGWSVVNAISGAVTFWQLSSDWEDRGNANWTGGTGTAADASSMFAGFGAYDTSLITPPILVSDLHAASASLRFKANFNIPAWVQNNALDLDISSDGGQHWTRILHWTTNHGTLLALPGESVKVDLAPYLPATGSFQLRWRYYDPANSLDWYAQIDDVVIGSCAPTPGGLFTGQITDANSGDGIVGATVKDDLGEGAKTVTNPADPNFPIGTYLLFARSGNRKLTASKSPYTPATARVSVNDDKVTSRNFTLKTARFEVRPNAFSLHVKAGGSGTASFALRNIGSAPGAFKVLAIDAPPPTNSDKKHSLIRIAVKDPSLMKASLPWIRRHANANGRGFMTRVARSTSHTESGWQGIPDYLAGTGDDFGALDPDTGRVYVLGGFGVNGVMASGAAYDPVRATWSAIADAPVARISAAAGFIGGKLYVVGGWDNNSDTVTELDIYDPATDSWSMGTPDPVAQGGGVAHAVLNDKLYLIGGCNGLCSPGLSDVEVYNPIGDSWSAAADYPETATFVSCGAIEGKLYCAGSLGNSGVSGSGYVYDPASNSWSPIADMANPQAGALYTATNGMLLVGGGFDSSGAITNAVEAYDPRSDSWDTMLPRMNTAVARGAGSCGFYQVGGITALSNQGAAVTASAEVLPGYDQGCGGFSKVPWVNPVPPTGTVAAGASARVLLALDGSGKKEFTTSRVYLRVLGNTPYHDLIVPLTVTWDPQPVNLSLDGKVSPRSAHKKDSLLYTLTVYNRHASGHGAATQVKLHYPLPPGVSYKTASGDATCTADAPDDSSSAAVLAAGGMSSNTVVCHFGRIALGASKSETLVVEATKAGKLTSKFKVGAREPDSDAGNNSLSLTSEVLGTADLALSAAKKASIAKGASGTLSLTLNNVGPDPASAVQLHAKMDGDAVSLRSAAASRGQCSVSGGTLVCELGQVDVGKPVTVKLRLFGAHTGSAAINAQASTASEEAEGANNSVAAQVTVAASPAPPHGGTGGGGALGWLALATLFGLACAGFYTRKRHFDRLSTR